MNYQLLLLLPLYTPTSSATLWRAWEDREAGRSNSYYFHQIKKSLHSMQMQTPDKAEPFLEALDQAYTMDDFEPPLFRFLVSEVLLCDSYDTLKEKLNQDDTPDEETDDDPFSQLMKKFTKWQQARAADQEVDRILSDDLKKLWGDVQHYQQTHTVTPPERGSDLSNPLDNQSKYAKRLSLLPWVLLIILLVLIQKIGSWMQQSRQNNVSTTSDT